MNFDVFISYATPDKVAADAACAKLEAEGIRCWIAPRDVPPGTQWAGAIVDAIDHCRAMVVIFSSSANASKQIHREVQRAFEREVPVVPFRIENVVPEQTLAYFMGPVHWLDALTPPLEQHLQKLAVSVRPFAESKGSARESEKRASQEAGIETSVDSDRFGPSEPRQLSRSWQRALLSAGAIGVVLVGAVGGWMFVSSSTRVQSPPSAVPLAVSAQPPTPLVPPPSASMQAGATPIQPAASGFAPLSRERESALKAKDIFKECEKCPEMTVVPAGSFKMGSSDTEPYPKTDERPQHLVTIARPIAAGQFPVTVDQFASFVMETGYDLGSTCVTFENGKFDGRQSRSWSNPGFPQDGSYPAVCVSWNDSVAYVAWLARKTGKAYRLLTEAEWEYVARAQTTTRYYFGDDEKELCRYGNGADQAAKKNVVGIQEWWRADPNLPNPRSFAPCNDGYAYTSPVGSFSPNEFNLYDMIGNVGQWTEDCYRDSYWGAPSDGSAWISGDCSRRVVRAGSWFTYPQLLRSAVRYVFASDLRAHVIGFRVARTLNP